MKGMYVASVTAFDKENRLHEDVQLKLMDRNLQEGAVGFFIGGSSGECFLLTPEERIRTFEVAATFLSKADLFAHVGALGTDEAIYYAKKAKKLGYKKISATPPFYFGHSQEAIGTYFKNISEAVDLPVLYYNIPMNTHKELDLTCNSTRDLLKSGYLSGIKHTNFDINQMERIRHINHDLEIYGGLEQNMIPFMSLGCESFIGSTFNFMLPHYKKIYELTLEKKYAVANGLQEKANTIMETIWNIGLFPSIKYILKKQGYNVGYARRPFIALSNEQAEMIDRVLEENLCN